MKIAFFPPLIKAYEPLSLCPGESRARSLMIFDKGGLLRTKKGGERKRDEREGGRQTCTLHKGGGEKSSLFLY